MFENGKIWIANDKESGEHIYLLPQMANRHGLIAGATGTGKTVTLKVLAESFSDMGVPVFLADVKGDLAGMCNPGVQSEDMDERIKRFGLAEHGFSYTKYPTAFWDLYGEKGIQLRTTVTEMGPLLLSRIMDLNELQTNLLSIAFKIADDNGLLLIDTKDLKALINYISENRSELEAEYGKMSPASLAAILRAIVALEIDGGETFFGEPGLSISDWLTPGAGGRGMIHILDSESLINNGRLYSTFLLWLLSELFEQLPEVGDVEKPKIVFFFDEAHLLFKGTSKALLDKIEQVVKLVRSKGVGVYFCTQNPRDIPDGVLAQLGNKIEHALHAYTPSEQRAVRAAADSFRTNPAFDTYEAIMALGTGEAVVSFLDEDGIPRVAQIAQILPPQSQMGSIDESRREEIISTSSLRARYAEAVDPDSAYEFLMRRGLEEEARKQKEAEEEAARKQREKEELAAQKQREKEEEAARKQREKEELAAQKAKEREEKAKKDAVKNSAKAVSSTVAGTLGREVGKEFGKKFGKFGQTLGGNLGASLGRGIIGTLFRRN